MKKSELEERVKELRVQNIRLVENLKHAEKENAEAKKVLSEMKDITAVRSQVKMLEFANEQLVGGNKDLKQRNRYLNEEMLRVKREYGAPLTARDVQEMPLDMALRESAKVENTIFGGVFEKVTPGSEEVRQLASGADVTVEPIEMPEGEVFKMEVVNDGVRPTLRLATAPKEINSSSFDDAQETNYKDLGLSG